MRPLALAFVIAAALIGAPPAGAQSEDDISAYTFAYPADEVYEAAVALAVDRGYAERGLVQPVLSGVVMPVALDLHQTLYIAGEHVDLYMRRQNGHTRLLIESLRPEMSRSARKQLAAYLNDLNAKLNQSNG